MIFGDYNTRDILWLGDWSVGWIAFLVMLGAAVFALSYYDLRNLAFRKRWALLGLRTSVYVIAVLMLLEPAIDLKHISKVKNHVAILVDTSLSMNLRTQKDDKTRHELAGDAIVELKRLTDQDHEEHYFSYFGFGEDLRSASADFLRSTPPTHTSTDLGTAFEALAEQFHDRDLAGVVVISDGIDTDAIGQRTRQGESLDDVSIEQIRRLNAPINTLVVSDAKGMRDVAIARVSHDDFAFVHNKVQIEVELQVIGMETTSFPITLRRDGELIQTRQLNVRESETRYIVNFEFVPQSVGKEIYTVSAPEFSGEALYENNTHHFLLRVIRDKIRVLQVVGRPSWDQRFLRGLLKNNPNVDLISFFILRTNANVQLVNPDELSLIPFPTDELFRDELGSFDLVIFQNFNFGPYNMRQYLPSIAQFVKDGGGFVMIGGDLSFANGGYARTPVEGILPVHLPSVTGQQAVDTREFRPQLTDAGHRHPITQLAFDPELNEQIWGDLPPLHGTNIVLGATDHATVLATHPRLTYGNEPMPVITVSEMEKGRVMALTSDSSWRWGFSAVGQGGTPREYQSFWSSAIRWLIKDPELKLLRIELPSDTYSPGETLEGSVRVFAPDYTPHAEVDGMVHIYHKSLDALSDAHASQRELIESIPFRTDASGQFQLDYVVDRVGVYQIEAEATTISGDLHDSDTLLTLEDTREYRDIVPRVDLMEAIAAASGGYHTVLPGVNLSALRFEPPRFVEVNHRKVIQLWDSFLLFFTILGLLALEWTLRRRWGRL